ncbi:hypothetical protein K438DRAFT_1887150 [Mycena galopus ATCC 62051]|nr:hypothetical protein K438DRAFT_1887150 [Mycena galopus ATCC 62051]
MTIQPSKITGRGIFCCHGQTFTATPITRLISKLISYTTTISASVNTFCTEDAVLIGCVFVLRIFLVLFSPPLKWFMLVCSFRVILCVGPLRLLLN